MPLECRSIDVSNNSVAFACPPTRCHFPTNLASPRGQYHHAPIEANKRTKAIISRRRRFLVGLSCVGSIADQLTPLIPPFFQHGVARAEVVAAKPVASVGRIETDVGQAGVVHRQEQGERSVAAIDSQVLNFQRRAFCVLRIGRGDVRGQSGSIVRGERVGSFDEIDIAAGELVGRSTDLRDFDLVARFEASGALLEGDDMSEVG